MYFSVFTPLGCTRERYASRSRCRYDEASNVIETHEHKGEFKEP
jgi:hypothetical protein